jgi:hypothetical protein
MLMAGDTLGRYDDVEWLAIAGLGRCLGSKGNLGVVTT